MLSEKIADSIENAEEYIEEALKWKSEFPEVSKTLASVSESEMGIMGSLHSAVTKVISDYRRAHGEPPESMMAVYDYLHKKQIDNSARVKAMQQMYKDG